MLIDPVFPDWFVVVCAALLGAVLGSFLNVCILRWGTEPKQSVMYPRSSCPYCGYQIRWYENIPIVSWLALRARCSGCRSRISALYPSVELAVALLWAGSAALVGPTVAAVELAIASTLLVGIAVSDARAYIIPHEFSLGGTAIALAFAAIPDGTGIVDALQGALFGAGLILLVGELTELALGQEAMGGGDCALMGMVGAFFGWEIVLPVVALGAVISLLLYVVSVMLQRPAASAREAAEGDTKEPGMRWRKVLVLLGGGAGLLALMLLALQAGLLGPMLLAAFQGTLGGGAAYYASFLLPERALGGRWPRVLGLLGAAAGVAIGAGLSPLRLAAGLAIGAAALWAVRGVQVAASPETTEELSSGGYIPFGVGLALAAGVLAFTGGPERMRRAFAELAPALGLG